MILLKSTDTLQVLLAGTVATNQAVLYAAYNDIAADGSTIAPGNSNGTTNNTTAVSWVGSPATVLLVRQVKYLSLYNDDTASITVTVRVNDGTNTRKLQKVTLAAGDRLEYVDGKGFTLTTASGTTGGGMSNPMTTAGDLIVGGTAGAATRLGIGSAGQVLGVVSGAEAWVGGEGISEPVNALTNSSGTVAINCALGDYFTITLSANVTTTTFSNLPASGKAQTLMLEIKQDGTGSWTWTWPSSFKWSGTAPVLSTAANSVDVLALTTFDQGTTWRATIAKAFA